MFKLFFKKKQEKKVQEEVVVEKNRTNLVCLIILDGLGVHPDPVGNAVLAAKTPFLDRAWTYGKSCLIHASGTYVGLPENEPGNSEVGHLNIGAGRVVPQSLPRINQAIERDELKDNEVIKKAIEHAKKHNNRIHFVGVLSDAGVHGHMNHLFHFLEVCKRNDLEPIVHAMLDGRDTGAIDAYYFISKLMSRFRKDGVGKIASMMGRLYGMDRDSRWERTELAYNCMVGVGKNKATDPFLLLQKSYQENITDEFVIPTTMVDENNIPIGDVKDNDVVVFFNFREDRARQLTKAFVIDEFYGFNRSVMPKNVHFVTMTGYEDDLPTNVVFPPRKLDYTLAKVLSDAGLRQLHISETEKFMQVTYFINGGVEKVYEGEDYMNVPSPKVYDYSQAPLMSAGTVTEEVVFRLSNNEKYKYNFVIINYANPDMLGHTGNMEATITANEFIDKCTEEVSNKVLELGGGVIIIADHGNCETMIDRETGKVDNAHTNNPVPFIYIDSTMDLKVKEDNPVRRIGVGEKTNIKGILADVAPTVLGVLGVSKPREMTGINMLDVMD